MKITDNIDNKTMKKYNKMEINKLDIGKFCQSFVKTRKRRFLIDNRLARIDNGENQQVTKSKNPLSKMRFLAIILLDNCKRLTFSIVGNVVTLSMNFHYQSSCKY